MKKILLSILLLTASTLIYSQSMNFNNNKVRIVDSTMGLGITPTSRLHVFGNGTASGLLNITNDKDATKDSSIVIDAIGNVGIGKAPASKLEVVDGLNTYGGSVPLAIARTMTNNKIAFIGSAVTNFSETYPAYNIGLYGTAMGGTNNFAGYFNFGNVYVNENLGIGEETPTSKLEVTDGYNTYGGSVPLAYFRTTINDKIAVVGSAETNISPSFPAYNIGLYGTAMGGTNNFAGYFNNGDVYINNNLGIGRLAPIYRLDVFGNGGTTDLLKVSNDINSTYDSTFVVDKVGKVGIGTTTPKDYLDINGNITFPKNQYIFWNAYNNGGTIYQREEVYSVLMYQNTDSPNYKLFNIDVTAVNTHRDEPVAAQRSALSIGYGAEVSIYEEKMYRDSLVDYKIGTTLSDNELYAFPPNLSWKGEIDVDSLGYTLFTAQIRCDADGTPYLEGVSWKRWSSKTYVELGSTDGYLNITRLENGMLIKNTLGYTIKATLRFRTKQ